MIRDLADLSLDGSLELIYAAIAASVAAGAVLGAFAVLLGTVLRSGD